MKKANKTHQPCQRERDSEHAADDITPTDAKFDVYFPAFPM